MDQSHSSLCVSSWHLGNPFTAGGAPTCSAPSPTCTKCHCMVPLGCSQVLCIATRLKTAGEMMGESMTQPVNRKDPFDQCISECTILTLGEDPGEIGQPFPCPFVFSSNLWILDLDTMVWRKVDTLSQTLLGRVERAIGIRNLWPEPRGSFLLLSVGGYLVVFGGYTTRLNRVLKWRNHRKLRDCWSFDPTTSGWTRLPDSPVYIDKHSLVVPVSHDETLIIVPKYPWVKYDRDYRILEGQQAWLYSFTLDTGLVLRDTWELPYAVRDIAIARMCGGHLLVAGARDEGVLEYSSLDTVSMAWGECNTPREDPLSLLWGLHGGSSVMLSHTQTLFYSPEGSMYVVDVQEEEMCL
ncbi:hypothetical protein KIPB_008983 [Kipferlia bialata]|uniref:Kelch-type beta propeller n=1 Tax=Kipferlia bialata TaxID=797122 RepID=A0A9K3D3N0_9EUKA|nr:hypothetical protein KIPB_008983 [Kipferlia bialata]|eukprot:g8983.t1